MTSLLVNIMDESKTDDVMRFLGDIPFLEVIPQGVRSFSRKPALLRENGEFRMAADFDDELPETFWSGDAT